jgi:hypothetical protein
MMSHASDTIMKHMVVCNCSCGAVVMTTSQGAPAVYHDAAPAELLCSHLRTQWPEKSFAVLSFPVL